MEHKADTGSFKCRKCGAPIQSENIYLCSTCTRKIFNSGLLPTDSILPAVCSQFPGIKKLFPPDVNKEKDAPERKD